MTTITTVKLTIAVVLAVPVVVLLCAGAVCVAAMIWGGIKR